MRCGAPVAHVSNPLRGPPWKSITRSKCSARSRIASAGVVAPSRQSVRPLGDDDRIDAGMMAHDRFGRCFNEVGDARVRKSTPQRADRRRGEDHVADQPQSN